MIAVAARRSGIVANQLHLKLPKLASKRDEAGHSPNERAIISLLAAMMSTMTSGRCNNSR
jgi:hypothetical protein